MYAWKNLSLFSVSRNGVPEICNDMKNDSSPKTSKAAKYSKRLNAISVDSLTHALAHIKLIVDDTRPFHYRMHKWLDRLY